MAILKEFDKIIEISSFLRIPIESDLNHLAFGTITIAFKFAFESRKEF